MQTLIPGIASAVLRFAVLAALLFLCSDTACVCAAPPEAALKSFKLADGFEISLVASEPDIRQPVAMQFDDRGRLWVVQYLQYPDPAGLKKVKVDQYMRTRFDRVPEPPPRGPKGADRITICEDTDGDGRMDKFKDFVAGLNMATGIAHGYGGVFVAQSPYLLFYPDRNRDDVPDGDPQVLVSGFGMEDSHAYPNSLQIGPDGWLYGAQGSNVWAKVEVTVDEHGQTYTTGVRGQGSGIRDQKNENSGQGSVDSAEAKKGANEASSLTPARRPLTPRFLEFNQCIFRYHPPTGRFEVFAEGGGNTWGVDFDRHGQIIAGTNFGGVCGLHMVQGGYYVKGFAKHGPLSNPHAYGYFEHMPYASPAKISQGEHVMCGGIVYQGGEFGAEIENQYITCALLHRAIYWHKLTPDRSTYKSDFGGALVTSDDPEFRPVDLALAPDGSVYIADWTDVRANHVIPEDTWNKTNGRIYRLAKKGTPRAEKVDLTKLDPRSLGKLLTNKNAFFRRAALQQIIERTFMRKDMPSAAEDIVVLPDDSGFALDRFFAEVQLKSGTAEKFLAQRLDDPSDHVRAWAIRLLGDARKVEPDTFSALLLGSSADKSAIVRSQLASTARRLSGSEALLLVSNLVQHDEDLKDPFVPMLTWWAAEPYIVSHCKEFLDTVDTDVWYAGRGPLIARAARRLASTGNDADLAACGKLLSYGPSENDQLIYAAIVQGLGGRRPQRVPLDLQEALAHRWKIPESRNKLLPVAFALGWNEAYREVFRIISDRQRLTHERVAWIERVGQSGHPDVRTVMLPLLSASEDDAIQAAAINALARIPTDDVADALLNSAETIGETNRKLAIAALATRPSWAKRLLSAVAGKRIPASAITTDLVVSIQQHNDSALTAALEKHVGKFSAQTSAEKQEQVNRVAKLLAAKSGDAAHGKAVFAKNCGTCHTLHGEGNKIGPDLTSADRGNRTFMLANIIDPNLGLRQEYTASTVRTVDGQVLTGIIIERTDAGLTLVDAKNVQHRIATDEIDELKVAEQSLMPEKALDPLGEGEIRDLFAYLEAGVRPAANRRALVTTFDSGIEEWTISGNGSLSRPEHQPTGGNGGGFLVMRDNAGTDMQLVAPLAFHGDLTHFTSGMAWFDAKTIDAASGQAHPVFGVLTISDGKTTIKQDLFHPTEKVPIKDWLRFSGRLTPEAFNTDAGTFQAVLSNVSSVVLTVEAFSNARGDWSG